ncbi:MAG: serine/threonine protein kinase [Planctomycetes bacterium]|nr:serine/threonine protein kinase [Planctomycetota bacterium]
MQIGPYNVVRELGRGGMGTVYEVRHPDFPRSLALKVVHQQILDEVSQARFKREGEALAAMNHPNVVSVHQLESYDGQVVLVTELVSGRSLQERLQEGPLPPHEARSLLRCTADAIAALHAKGLIHRDLKPDNVLLREDGSPVLIDFGLARSLSGSSLTQTGEILGTPSYMAPEQARDASSVDERCDVYALGALLFACLAGHPPFRGPSTLQTLDRVLNQPPDYPPESKTWPSDLRALCARALAKDPSERPESAIAFGEGLVASASRRPSSGLVWGVLVALIGLGGATWAFVASRSEGPLSPALGEDSIRNGDAPLPSASQGSERILCWSGVRQLLAGQEPTAEHRTLATAESPEAHALAAVLAARDGDRAEVRRQLDFHGEPQRKELQLLPALVRGRLGRLSTNDARAVLKALEGWSEAPLELRGLRALAEVVLKQSDPLGILSAPTEHGLARVQPWLLEQLLRFGAGDPLDLAKLEAISDHSSRARPATQAALTERVALLIRHLAPDSNTRDYTLDEYRLLTQAIQTFRVLVPHPVPLPNAHEIGTFVVTSGVDIAKSTKSLLSEEKADLLIAVAEAVPDDSPLQASAGQLIWRGHLSCPARWRRLLGIARRGVVLLESPLEDGSSRSASLFESPLSRLLRLLVGLQEALPPPERDSTDLEEALAVIERLALISPTYKRKDAAIDRVYVRLLLGRLTQRELEGVPLGVNRPRLELAKLYLATPDRLLTDAPHMLDSLRFAKREVTRGALAHRLGLDRLWPKGGPQSPLAAAREPLIEALATTLSSGRSPVYALYWQIQAARLALAASAPNKYRVRLAVASMYATKGGWTGLAEDLDIAARLREDSRLAALAERALKLKPRTSQQTKRK